jgi:hypothetical protein
MSSNNFTVETPREIRYSTQSIALYGRRFLAELFKVGLYASNGSIWGILTLLTFAVLAICPLGNPPPTPTPTPLPF